MNPEGFLPVGLHDGDLREIEAHFGSFNSSDKRPRLFAKLREYVAEVTRWGHAEELLLDGSFASDKPAPEDIDLILVHQTGFDLESSVLPAEYNVTNAKRVLSRYGFQVFAVLPGSRAYSYWVGYFSQDTRKPGLAKGLVRLRL